jgi:hypothetical protein
MTNDGLANYRAPKLPGSTPDNTGKKPPNWGCFGCLGIFLLIPILAVIGSAVGAANKEPYDGNNKYEAIAQCEARIEGLLKSPATAEFETDAVGGGTWSVTGTVDSENGFGALVRSDFECTVVMNGGGSATTTVEHLTQR